MSRSLPQEKFVEIASITAVLLFAAINCFYCLDQESLRMEEYISYIHFGDDSLHTFLHNVRLADPPMSPFYYTVEFLWANFISNSVYGARVLSILFGMATILVIYLLGRMLYDPKAGVLAALIMAMFPQFLFYSQEIRMYTLVWFQVVVSVLFLLLSLYGRRKTLWLCLNLATNLILLWTHWFGALLIAAQGVFLLLHCRRNFKMVVVWALCESVWAISIAAWISTTDFHRLDQVAGWIGLPGATAGLLELWRDLGFLTSGIWGTAGLVVILGLLVYLGVLSFARVSGIPGQETSCANRPPASETYFLLMLWFVLPTIGLFLLSHFYRPCYVSRYIYFKLPALCILLGAGGVALFRKNRFAGMLAIGILLAAYAHELTLLERPLRINYAGTARALAKAWHPGDVVVLTDVWQRDVFLHYAKIDVRSIQCETTEQKACDKACALLNPKRRVWLFITRARILQWPLDKAAFQSTLSQNGRDVQLQPVPGPQALFLLQLHSPST
jgi:uncharacterized membrane protein